MKNITDYENPFDAITEFETALAEYTGAPYVITTDSCTHAIELCLRYLKIKTANIPSKTYLSVPMTLHNLGIEYTYRDEDWRQQYNIKDTPIWDSARMLMPGMYMWNQYQCLSFGRTKPLEIGRGGAILCNSAEAYNWLKPATYDGRWLKYSPWETQKVFNTGYHYMMRPEECVEGLNKLEQPLVPQGDEYYEYPECKDIQIVD